MELSYSYVNETLKTLPIGFYAGRRIPMELSKEAETSYYMLTEDRIVISYPIIYTSGLKVTDESRKEETVRAMLYHEVSHAILTPSNLSCDDIYNIFEDERIETLLANYYLDVDFKAQLYRIINLGKPKTPKEAFFNLVRFRSGPTDLLKKVEEIIQKNKGITRATHDWRDIDDYEMAIYHLFNEVEKLFKKKPSSFTPPKNGEKQGKSGEKQKEKGEDGSGQSAKNQMNDLAKSESDSDQENDQASADKEEEQGGRSKGTKGALSEKDLKKILKKALSPDSELTAQQQQELSDFRRKIEIVLSNYNKKNSNGNGITAYSGILNPRLAGRSDYRFFEHSINSNGNNKFGNCHLNLVIDKSGSFWNNEDIVNAILSILSEIERKSKNFSMTVSFIGMNFETKKKGEDRSIHCNGGNNVPEDIREIMMKLQKQNSYNYNLILFDGDAFSDNDWSRSKQRSVFRGFDMRQATMITDYDNERYIDHWTSTKVIYTEDYVEELIKNVAKVLTMAFS